MKAAAVCWVSVPLLLGLDRVWLCSLPHGGLHLGGGQLQRPYRPTLSALQWPSSHLCLAPGPGGSVASRGPILPTPTVDRQSPSPTAFLYRTRVDNLHSGQYLRALCKSTSLKIQFILQRNLCPSEESLMTSKFPLDVSVVFSWGHPHPSLLLEAFRTQGLVTCGSLGPWLRREQTSVEEVWIRRA